MSFDSWQKSVEYYKNWQSKHYTNPDEDYYVFLKRIKYATSENYKSMLLGVKLPKDLGLGEKDSIK